MFARWIVNLVLLLNGFPLVIGRTGATNPCPGCPEPSSVDQDILLAAQAAIKALEKGVCESVSICGGIKLLKVEKAEKQVVAGTNYILSLRLEARGGPPGSAPGSRQCILKFEKICQNIVVFKPLPFDCQTQDGCLKLTKQEAIVCSVVRSEESRHGGGHFLFSIDTKVDASNLPQCTGDGKSNCKGISLNKKVMDGLQVGDKVSLLPGLDLLLTLRRLPSHGISSTSFSFTVGEHGEATITVGESAVYGSIKPTQGSVDYTIENCGSNCNVIYERDVGYFNQFED